MEEPKIREIGINFDDAMLHFAGNKKLFDKYLNKFKDDEHIAAAKIALDNKDYNDIIEQIHALKGISGTLGMEKLFESCNHIVEQLRADNRTNLEENMEEMEKEFTRLVHAIE